MKIEEFLDATHKWGLRNKWLKEPEWVGLYIRCGVMYARQHDGAFFVIDKALHLSSFEALKPRTGAFTRLIQRIEAHSPRLPIFIENLTDKGFAEKLPKLGFEQVWTSDPSLGDVGSWCFVKRHGE